MRCKLNRRLRLGGPYASVFRIGARLPKPGIYFGLLIAIVQVFASPAFAHNSSVTVIDVRIAGRNLAVTLRLNQADLMEHVLRMPHGPVHFADRQEYEDAAPAVLSYVVGRLHINVDGRPLVAPVAPDWPAQHIELTHVDAGGLEVASPIPLTLRYEMPEPAKRIELRSQLYAEPGFAALFVVNFYPGDGVKPVTRDVDANQPVAFDVPGVGSVSGATGNRDPKKERWPRHTIAWIAVLAAFVTVVIFGVVWRRTRKV